MNAPAKRCHQRDVHRGFSYWHDMVRRTEAVTRDKNSSYGNASVCEEWSDFESFSAWFVEQPKQHGWVLDKDLLSSGAKIYSSETCCFIPREINQMLVCNRRDSGGFPGVYRRGSKFVARVKARNRRIHVGTYGTQEEALSNYLSVKTELLSTEAENYRFILDPKAYQALKKYDFKKTLESQHDL
ncbi:AP2 domain-containing protein [Pseudomonas protegens]|uniref:AP2 domain-containing protein n=1 Tax=Pseudomonas protegens TaxID=380021 RepID=UPI001B33CC0A|nr:AP2 domain-containing protein [Pseudomonas protegens]MBP5120980.1 hypothetical protein [Pseudomonas protegens]